MKNGIVVARFLGMIVLLVFGMLLPLLAQQAPAEATLSGRELAGKKLFLQRCSYCHLPPLTEALTPNSKPYGPKLNGYVKGTEMEALASETIRNGTARMPGFRYSMKPGEIENIIAYLKTLK